METWQTVVVGLVATGLADLWQQALKHGAGLLTANWRLVGRWVAGMSRGVLVQPGIAAAVAVPGEVAIGWTFHYLGGVVYAGLYLAIVGAWPGASPSLGSALAFAAVTLILCPGDSRSTSTAWEMRKRGRPRKPEDDGVPGTADEGELPLNQLSGAPFPYCRLPRMVPARAHADRPTLSPRCCSMTPKSRSVWRSSSPCKMQPKSCK
jgi:hypothetical protein